jgi:hypothetical protein
VLSWLTIRPARSGHRAELVGSIMRDAQIGLLIATPLILVFAVLLYHKGALRLGGMIIAGAASIAIALVLFFSH